jgi:hypothetical protein
MREGLDSEPDTRYSDNAPSRPNTHNDIEELAWKDCNLSHPFDSAHQLGKNVDLRDGAQVAAIFNNLVSRAATWRILAPRVRIRNPVASGWDVAIEIENT